MFSVFPEFLVSIGTWKSWKYRELFSYTWKNLENHFLAKYLEKTINLKTACVRACVCALVCAGARVVCRRESTGGGGSRRESAGVGGLMCVHVELYK